MKQSLTLDTSEDERPAQSYAPRFMAVIHNQIDSQFRTTLVASFNGTTTYLIWSFPNIFTRIPQVNIIVDQGLKPVKGGVTRRGEGTGSRING